MVAKFDATGDANYQVLDRLSKLYDLPEYVKQASPEETLNPQGLPAAAFADPALRQFPCHTKAACYVSALYYLEHRDQLPPAKRELVRQNLMKSATRHNIQQAVSAANARHHELAELGKEASLPDSAFAIVFANSDGSKDRRYPLRNAAEVQKAAGWLLEHRDLLPFADRHKLATAILDKAAEFNVTFPTELDFALEKQAGRGVYDPGRAAEMLRNRALCRGVPQPAQEQLCKLAAQLEADPLLAEDPSTTYELAATVDQVDRSFGLVSKYAEGLPRPEDVLFAGSIKYASQFVEDACPTLTGAIYDREQFAKLSLASIRDTLGDELARAVATGLLVDPVKMADVASTLPLPDAVALDRMMQAVGEAPVRQKLAQAGLTDAERRQLATEYQLSQRGQAAASLPSGVGGSRVV